MLPSVLTPASRAGLLPAPLLPSQSPRLSRPFLNHFIAFGICILVAFVFTLPGSLSPGSALLGYPGDNYQHAWFLCHFARSVAHHENPFYTNLLFYPNRTNLAWSTTDPLAGTLALPLSFLAGPVIAYNLALIFQLALSAFFARLLCLRITRNEVAALFGGAMFGFAPFFLAHALGHLSLVTAFPIPLFVLLLDRIFSAQRPSWKLGLPLGLTMLMTAFAHYDYVVLCLLLAFFWALIELVVRFREERFAILARVWKPLAVAAATFLICFSPILNMLAGSHADVPIPRGLSHIKQFSADAFGFLIPSWNHVLLGHFAKHLPANLFVAGFEGTVYIGPVALALVLLAVFKAHASNNVWKTRALVLGLIFYLLSLGPVVRVFGQPTGIPGPTALLYHLPFASFFSAPARFHVIVALCVAILSSLAVKLLLDRYSTRTQQSLLITVLSVLLLCDYLTIPFPTSSIIDPAAGAPSSASPPAAAQACGLPPDIRGGAVVTFPLLIAPYAMKSMWMQISDDGRYALLDGYLSYTPQGTWATLWNTSILRSLLSLQGIVRAPIDPSADRASVPTATRDLHINTVVVFDSPYRDAALAYLPSVLPVPGQRSGSCTVFRLQTAPAAAAYSLPSTAPDTR